VKKLFPSTEKKLTGNEFAVTDAWNKPEEAKKYGYQTGKTAPSPRGSKSLSYNKEFGMKTAAKTANPLDLVGGMPASEKKGGVKGLAANCKKKGNDAYPSCNWYDAKAYCGGRLPAVAKLKWWYKAECGGGKKNPGCAYWFWSSEKGSKYYEATDDSDEGATDEYNARYVSFESGQMGEFGMSYKGGYVKCH